MNSERTRLCRRCMKRTATSGYLCERCRRLEEKNSQTMLPNSQPKKIGAYNETPFLFFSTESESSTPVSPQSFPFAVVIISLLTAILMFVGIRYCNYSSAEEKMYDHYQADCASSGNTADFISDIISQPSNWQKTELAVYQKPEGFLSYIFSFSEKSASVSCWVENRKTIYYYNFDGYDAGTGLEGRFYLTEINGKLSIVDKDRRRIFPEGTAFFKRHYDTLSSFGYTTVMKDLTEKLDRGTLGRNGALLTEILKSGKISACIYDQSKDICILDESGEIRLYYQAIFSNGVSSKLPDFSDYSTAKD